MNIFEYRHDAGLGQAFVNGSCELGEVRHATIDGHDILYCTGSALLDNSCCGNYGCSYALVIGAVVEGHMAGGGAQTTSLLREISANAALADAIRRVLIGREAIGVVNLYLAPTA